MQLFDLPFVLDSNLMDSMTEIDHFHDNNFSCFQVLTPKNKHRCKSCTLLHCQLCHAIIVFKLKTMQPV